MKKFFLLITLFCALKMQAQVAWQKNYKVSDPAAFTVLESALTMLQTADGGYLVGGTYTQANEARLAYLMKIDANGDSVWTKLYPYSDRLTKLYIDNNNDLRGIFEVWAAGNGVTLYFTKLDASNGDTISSFKAPKPTAFDVYRYTSHIQLPDNSYLLAAQGSGQGGHFLRFTPGAATATWYADSMASKVMSFTDMILDGQDVVLSGWSAVPGGTSVNFLVAKYDITNGTPIWRRVLLFADGQCCDTRGRCIVKNSQGNYVAGGEWREKFNNIIYITPALFVVSPNGDSLSITETHTGGTVQDIMKWGNYLLASGQIEKDDVAPDNSNAHHTDIALLVMDDNGQLLNFSQRFNNLIMIPNNFGGGYLGTYWSSGGIMSNTSNDVLIYGQGVHLPVGNNSTDQNTFITKLTPNTTGIAAISKNDKLMPYPNPFNNTLYVNTNEESGKVLITNIFGQKVYEQKVNRSININAQSWPAGAYFIQFDNGKTITKAKVVKQ